MAASYCEQGVFTGDTCGAYSTRIQFTLLTDGAKSMISKEWYDSFQVGEDKISVTTLSFMCQP
jgi:hypothetical protein